MADSVIDVGPVFDDPNTLIEIYTTFITKAVLEDADREKLKKDRGFSDEIIDLCQFKSCRPENREIIEQLRATFKEEELVEAGILEAGDEGIKPCSQLLGVFDKNGKFGNNICIPYFNEDGKIFYLRPHKYGFKGKGINIYCPARNMSGDKTWIITESEFKAAAAIQLGYPAIGLPGIHSFAVNNFERLKEFIEANGISKVVIIYDNEIKNNPAFKNYKPDVLKQWDTQWRSVDLARKLIRALPDLALVKIGVLPESWMIEGKIDIDGALAQGKTSAELRSIIYRAYDWEEYLAIIPPIARKIISRKIYKEDYANSCKIKKQENGYYAVRSKKIKDEVIPFDEQVSNFTMEIKKTLVEGDNYTREIIFKGQDGSVSKPYVCNKGTNILREFKTWAWACGDFHFTGKQEDLDEIWKLEGALSDGREIQRPEKIGFIKEDEEPLWLFGNCLIKENDGSLCLPDKDGIIWDGLTGYLPQSIKQTDSSSKTVKTGHVPTINLDMAQDFGMKHLKETVNSMEKIYGNKAIKLSVGWIVACLLSHEIHKKYNCFPILFIGGKRESGKTTLANWLMAMAGFTDTAGDSLESTSQAGSIRNLAWYCSLPYWLDEYRNNSKIAKFDGFFRNVYGRQAPSKGTLSERVRSHAINAGILLSGEETPQDNALLSRCVVIPLTKNNKKETIDLFNTIESLRVRGLLSRLIPEVLKIKQKILPILFEHIDGWKKRLVDNKVGERIALNYAIPAVCYDLIFLRDEDVSVRQEFARWVVEESHRTELEKESEHMLSIFMEDLVTIHDKLTNYYTVFTQNKEAKGKRRIAVHFPTFYSLWTETYRRKGLEQFKRATMLSYIKEEKYFLADNHLKRIHGKPTRCLILSLDPEDNPPDGLLYLADGVPEGEEGIADAIDSIGDGAENPMF